MTVPGPATASVTLSSRGSGALKHQLVVKTVSGVEDSMSAVAIETGVPYEIQGGDSTRITPAEQVHIPESHPTQQQETGATQEEVMYIDHARKLRHSDSEASSSSSDTDTGPCSETDTAGASSPTESSIDVDCPNVDSRPCGGGGSVSGDPPECRICFQEDCPEDPLLTACACTGSVGHIHTECLKRWCLQEQCHTCEICKQPFDPKVLGVLPGWDVEAQAFGPIVAPDAATAAQAATARTTPVAPIHKGRVVMKVFVFCTLHVAGVVLLIALRSH